MLSRVEHENFIITLGHDQYLHYLPFYLHIFKCFLHSQTIFSHFYDSNSVSIFVVPIYRTFNIPYLFGYKTGVFLSRMTTNN